MSFFCNECDVKLALPYEWMGMSIKCPACGHGISLRYQNGQTISNSGYAISFEDFCQLMKQPGDQNEAHLTIAKLMDCTVEKIDGVAVLKTGAGGLIPFEFAHLSIQADPAKQQQLYSVAMSLWR